MTVSKPETVKVTQADIDLLAEIVEAAGNKAAAFTLRSSGAVGTVLRAQAELIARHRLNATPSRQDGEETAKLRSKIEAVERVLGFEVDGPCPICNGIEGCSHSLGERIRAALSSTSRQDGLREAQRPIETMEMWETAVVTDGEHAAVAQKVAIDVGGHCFVLGTEEGLKWEPTHWSPLPAHAALPESPALREKIEAAYREGHDAGQSIFRRSVEEDWQESETLAALSDTPPPDNEEPWPGCFADLQRRRVETLAKLGLMLSLMAGGEAAEVVGYDAADLYTEVLMALAIEDSDNPDIALEEARDHPEGDMLLSAFNNGGK